MKFNVGDKVLVQPYKTLPDTYEGEVISVKRSLWGSTYGVAWKRDTGMLTFNTIVSGRKLWLKGRK